MLAGAISMALGEWLSVQSSRELYSHQIAVETAEIESAPEEEAEELALIYEARGLKPEHARNLANQILENKESAVQTMVREELGIDPDELGGSAWEAAITSFFLFILGAIIPVAPFIFLTGSTAVLVSIGLSVIGLFLLGASDHPLHWKNSALFRIQNGHLRFISRSHYLWYWSFDWNEYRRLVQRIQSVIVTICLYLQFRCASSIIMNVAGFFLPIKCPKYLQTAKHFKRKAII